MSISSTNKKEMSTKHVPTASPNSSNTSESPSKTKASAQSMAPNSLSSSTNKAMLPQDDRIKYLDARQNYETVAFIWYDSQLESRGNIVGALRMINNYVQSYTDPLLCFTSIKSSNDRAFFICASTDADTIAMAETIATIEAILIFKLDGQSIKTEIAKLVGVYEEQEALLRALKETLEIFQQVRLEEFAFEDDNNFLWSQLWRAEVRTNNKDKYIFSTIQSIHLDNDSKIKNW